MKLWLDDIRPPPDGSWVWAKSVHMAAYQMGLALGQSSWPHNPGSQPITELSLDHDLGGDSTGQWVADQIEEMATIGIRPPKWTVHSMNPVGRWRLTAALENADARWNKWVDDQINDLLDADRSISAIKLVRDILGYSLLDAKRYVEKMITARAETTRRAQQSSD